MVRLRPEDAPLLGVIEAQVMDELNVHAVEVAAEDSLATFKLRPNLPVLGPKYGPRIRDVRAALDAADAAAVAAELRTNGRATVGDFEFEASEVLVDVEERPGMAMAMDGTAGVMVGMDLTLTPELEAEGLARELVHRIQNMRKTAGLEIEDHILTYVGGGVHEGTASALAAHDAYIRQETLSEALYAESPPAGAYVEEHDIDGAKLTVGVVKAGV